MEANQSSMYTLETGDDASLSFDQNDPTSEGGDTDRSRQSNMSTVSGAFRDTHVDQDDANTLMKK